MEALPADHIAAYEQIIECVVAWATEETRIRAAMIVGSRARTDHPADAWSDLDVVLFATDPDALLAETGWVHRMGTPVITFLEPTAVGMWKERRALFAGALDVDFSIVPAAVLAGVREDRLGDGTPIQEVAGVIARGVRLLVDKDGSLAALLAHVTHQPLPTPPAPDQARFDQILSDFWYHAVWIAKKLRRGELVVAHECLEGNQRRLLMTLIRWHAGMRRSIWHGRRFLEEWADPRVVAALPGTWARHEPADIVRATRAMMDLVALLAGEIAAATSLTLPADAEHAARTWFDGILIAPAREE